MESGDRSRDFDCGHMEDKLSSLPTSSPQHKTMQTLHSNFSGFVSTPAEGDFSPKKVILGSQLSFGGRKEPRLHQQDRTTQKKNSPVIGPYNLLLKHPSVIKPKSKIFDDLLWEDRESDLEPQREQQAGLERPDFPNLKPCFDSAEPVRRKSPASIHKIAASNEDCGSSKHFPSVHRQVDIFGSLIQEDDLPTEPIGCRVASQKTNPNQFDSLHNIRIVNEGRKKPKQA